MNPQRFVNKHHDFIITSSYVFRYTPPTKIQSITYCCPKETYPHFQSKKSKNLIHAVYSRTQQGRQREPSVKTVGNGFPTFHRILEALRVEWRNSTPLYASTRNRNKNFNKYFISSSGDWTHNRGVVVATLLCPGPRRSHFQSKFSIIEI